MLDLEPNHAGAHFGLAGIYMNRGWQEKAVAAWKRFLELDPQSPKAAFARASLELATRNNISVKRW